MMTGSSWSKRVWNWLRCNWSDFHPRYQFWVEKSIGNGFTMLWISIILHSWSSVPLDQEESETGNGAICLIFPYKPVVGPTILWNGLKTLEIRFHLHFDHRLLLIKKNYKKWCNNSDSRPRNTFLAEKSIESDLIMPRISFIIKEDVSDTVLYF